MAATWRCALPLALTVIVSACATPSFLMEPPPVWHGTCIDASDARVEAALSSASLPSAPDALASALISRLHTQERQAIMVASAYAAAELGNTPSAQDLTALRPISRRAFYEGFTRHGYCALPQENKFLGADYFINALNVYLSNRGVVSESTFRVGGEPTVGWEEQRELMSWLIIAAAQAPPNNSFKPKPLRGSA